MTMDEINSCCIPELLTMIAKYLEKHHVVKCLRVCKHWYRILAPVVWRSVDNGSSTVHALTRENLLKYSDLIFKLTNSYILPQHCIMTFPNLHTVDLSSAFFDMHDSLDRSYATELISLNPSLINICVCRPNPTPDIQFWKAVSNLQHLKSIRTVCLALHEGEMEMFWKALSKLENADLYFGAFPTDCQQPSSMFYQMRKMNLAIKSDSAVQLQAIRSCPNIECLIWRVRIENEVCDQFASDVEHGLWPKLKAIEFGYYWEDEYSSRVLNSMQRPTKITAGRNFGPLSFQSLQHHFSTLTHVDIAHCRGVTSLFTQEILCSCPLLVDFAASILYVKYIENCRPWVCLSMKKLRLCFAFIESEGNLQPLVFERLSTLTHLLEIDIGRLEYSDMWPPNGTCLDIRLKSGLGLLSSWKNIKRICLSNTTQVMEETDIQWIISNWRRIEGIEGKLNQDLQTDTHLRAMLQVRGIEEY